MNSELGIVGQSKQTQRLASRLLLRARNDYMVISIYGLHEFRRGWILAAGPLDVATSR